MPLSIDPAEGELKRAVERVHGGTGHPLLRIRTDRPDVTNGRAAKVSVQHSVAVAFIYGAAGLPQYDDQCIGEPTVLQLRRKVNRSDLGNV
jgi:2-methylcitrate dehydratase PrpD